MWGTNHSHTWSHVPEVRTGHLWGGGGGAVLPAKLACGLHLTLKKGGAGGWSLGRGSHSLRSWVAIFPLNTSRMCFPTGTPGIWAGDPVCRPEKAGQAGWEVGCEFRSAEQGLAAWTRASRNSGLLPAPVMSRTWHRFPQSVNVASHLRKAGLALKLQNRNEGVFICITKGLVCFFK